MSKTNYPADRDGVFVNSGELTISEISSCQCDPECWHVDDQGLGWGKISKEVAIARLAFAAYRAYGKTTDFKNYRGEPMPDFSVLPEKIQEAWKAATSEILWQVRY